MKNCTFLLVKNNKTRNIPVIFVLLFSKIHYYLANYRNANIKTELFISNFLQGIL